MGTVKKSALHGRKDGSDRGVAKNLEISFLLDFYGDMLTDK